MNNAMAADTAHRLLARSGRTQAWSRFFEEQVQEWAFLKKYIRPTSQKEGDWNWFITESHREWSKRLRAR